MISLDWTLFVQMAIFLSFVVYVNVYLLRPMVRYMARRKSTISDLHDSGGEQKTTLERLQSDYSRKISQAREEMLSQRTAARKEAMVIQNSILDEAKKESNQELSKADSELRKDILAAKETLDREARVLASKVTEKVLGRAFR